MNYELKMRALVKEAFKFKKYKKLSLPLRILTIIVEIPFIVLSLLSVGLFYVYYCIFNLITDPIEYVKSIIRNEGKEVKHATQFIIYFFGFPFVVLATIFISFLTLFLAFSFFFANLYGEVATLHGFKFQPFISSASEDFEINVSDKKYNLGVLVSFLVINYVLLIGMNIFMGITISTAMSNYNYYYEWTYHYDFTYYIVYMVFYSLYLVSMFLFSFFGFEDKKEEKLESENTNSPVEIETQELDDNTK